MLTGLSNCCERADVTEAMTDEMVPPGRRDALLREVLSLKLTWRLQVQLEDGTWDLYGMPTDDREALQRTQDFRARKYPEERRRVIECVESHMVVDIEEPGRDPGPLPPSLPGAGSGPGTQTGVANFLAANPQHNRKDADGPAYTPDPAYVRDLEPEEEKETSD
jgi:hypothetical protein